jgi:hypothetical protein
MDCGMFAAANVRKNQPRVTYYLNLPDTESNRPFTDRENKPALFQEVPSLSGVD